MGGLFKKPTPEPEPAPTAAPPRQRKGPVTVALDDLPDDIQRILQAVAADQVDQLKAAAAEYDVTQLWIGPQTLLHCAAQNGGLGVARWLLEEGLDADMPTTGSAVTPLLYAVRAGHVEIARLLLGNGADVNVAISATDPRYPGLSPLHAAAISGNADMVRLLLERGADPSARDGQGLTPLESALKVGQEHLQAAFAKTPDKVQPVQTAPRRPTVAVRDMPAGKFNYQATFKFASFFGQGEGALQIKLTGNNETDAKLRAEQLLGEMMDDEGDKKKLEAGLGFPIVFWALEEVRKI